MTASANIATLPIAGVMASSGLEDVLREEQKAALQALLQDRVSIEGLQIGDRMVVEPINLAQASQIVDQTMAALVARYKNRKTLFRAIEKNAEGTTFVCDEEECDEPISHRRIKAQPTAIYCIHCQEKKEREAGGGDFYLLYAAND